MEKSEYQRRKELREACPEGVGYVDGYSPPLPVDVREVWVDGRLEGITMKGQMLLPADHLAGMVGARWLTAGDEMIVRYNGRLYFDCLWLQETFPGAADAVREMADRCCEVRGWKRLRQRGTIRVREKKPEFVRRIHFYDYDQEARVHERTRIGRVAGLERRRRRGPADRASQWDDGVVA